MKILSTSIENFMEYEDEIQDEVPGVSNRFNIYLINLTENKLIRYIYFKPSDFYDFFAQSI